MLYVLVSALIGVLELAALGVPSKLRLGFWPPAASFLPFVTPLIFSAILLAWIGRKVIERATTSRQQLIRAIGLTLAGGATPEKRRFQPLSIPAGRAILCLLT